MGTIAACASSTGLPCESRKATCTPAPASPTAAVAPARQDPADGHVLVVVEEHDLGPATGKGVALQIERQHQEAINLAGEDQVATLRQIVDLLDDRDLRGRIDHARRTRR
jgi:hypothetical protein